MTFENRDFFPAEISFFEQCMRRKGFERAFKHGRYTAESVERRRQVVDLLRAMRALTEDASA